MQHQDDQNALNVERAGQAPLRAIAILAGAVTLVPRTFANLLRQHSRWMTRHQLFELLQGLTKEAAKGSAPLADTAERPAGCTCLLPQGWFQVMTVTTAILHLQRLSCWLQIRRDRTPWHAVGAESLLSGVVGSLSFLLALGTPIAMPRGRRKEDKADVDWSSPQ